MGDYNATPISGQSHCYVRYTDSDSPFTYGSFGYGSANCPAAVIQGRWYETPTGYSDSLTMNTDCLDLKGVRVTNGMKCGSGPVAYPAWATKNDVFVTSASGTANSDYDNYENWVLDASTFAKADLGSLKAVYAVPPTGTLELFVQEGSSSATEKSAATAEISGFTYTNVSIVVRNTADSLVRLATTANTSADIVVDDLSFNQWSAASYGDSGNSPFYTSAYASGQGCPNYYVYQNGWVTVEVDGATTNRVITLAPARAKENANEKCLVTIRSPLMDGDRKVSGNSETRGIGLGMMSFTYRNADSNCVVHVQWAPCASASSLLGVTEEAAGAAEWTTVATFDFSTLTAAERKSGTLSGYVGEHGTKGVMRLAIDTAVVAKAQAEETNPGKDAAYGAIEIVSFLSRDEPAIDESCWWGWNLRTTDAASERSLYDSAPSDVGMALALNNSVTDAIDADTADLYPQHLPFVQTPTFATNLVGEISFRARRLPGASGPTEVAVFGAKDGGVTDEASWAFLTNVVVTGDAYRQFTYRTPEGQDYAAFRLAVIGVTGLNDDVPNHKDEMDESLGGNPARVLIDEVYVSEAVRGQLAFRDVGAFRGNLSSTAAIADVTAKSNQPMVNESWGVQGEVYVAQMEEELDLDKGVRVFFRWFRGTEPWGYANWRGLPAAKGAELSRATGTTAKIFRSSYDGSPEAVVLPTTTNEVVQYVLEVEYYAKGATTPSTNVLSAADWTRPAWYHPVDFNAGADAFAAYTILDTVAPGWAWINEVNVFGTADKLWQNSDAARQFIEIAMPQEADLTGWEVRLLDGQPKSATVTTNLIAKFGYEVNGTGKIPATKTKNAASNCVFMVLASQPTKVAGTLSAEEGEIDGYWRLANRGTGQTFEPDHSLGYGTPFGIQLVRPSGVIEHEIVVRGYDQNAGTVFGGEDPQDYVDNFNANEEGGAFFFAGSDDSRDTGLTLGVLANAGATSNDWSNAVAWSPGRINAGQVIDPDHPTPFGSSVVIYLNVGRYLQQTATASDGTATVSRDNLVQVVPKGDATGLVVDYVADPWYELGGVTTNGVAATATSTGERAYRLTVAQNCSNDTLTVNAETAIQKELSEKYGLTDDNRYRDAVMAWLRDGTTVDGTAWTGTAGDVHLAEFRDMAGDFVTNLTLTAMYWLDIPPTEPGWILRGGTTAIQPHAEQAPAGSGLTNVQVSVYMAISNSNATASSEPHPPTVLRGLAPGETSRDYDLTAESAPAWTSVTFKVTGFMLNGLTSQANPDNWVPLRWFVFDENSFYPRGNAKEFQSVIDVRYPYTKESPAQSYGLSEWMRVHAGETFPTFTYFWAIDDRLKPVTVEILKPDSTY